MPPFPIKCMYLLYGMDKILTCEAMGIKSEELSE